jgi:hypothetical protein
MKGKEKCEMLERVYRPLGSGAETNRRFTFKPEQALAMSATLCDLGTQ